MQNPSMCNERKNDCFKLMSCWWWIEAKAHFPLKTFLCESLESTSRKKNSHNVRTSQCFNDLMLRLFVSYEWIIYKYYSIFPSPRFPPHLLPFLIFVHFLLNSHLLKPFTQSSLMICTNKPSMNLLFVHLWWSIRIKNI